MNIMHLRAMGNSKNLCGDTSSNYSYATHYVNCPACLNNGKPLADEDSEDQS